MTSERTLVQSNRQTESQIVKWIEDENQTEKGKTETTKIMINSSRRDAFEFVRLVAQRSTARRSTSRDEHELTSFRFPFFCRNALTLARAREQREKFEINV